MKTDIQIANSVRPKPIAEIATKAGISDEFLETYGKSKAKIDLSIFKSLVNKQDGHIILVTAISPTPAGEGKTTTTIGLGDALSKLGKQTIIALREPSLGPVFGLKGGATGGGYAQVIPMEDINLHFTGDFHAITSANNLLSAMVDNHIKHGNELDLDIEKITWKRCLDMNDRALRKITIAQGGKINGKPREDGFDISVASEVMAILCLSNDIQDLRKRLGEVIVGYTKEGTPVTCKMLKAEGAMTVLLKDAMKPNLVQTLEGTPTIIHGGPFANIAHGCNSIVATKIAQKLGHFTVTEAGFGADLGAEKFLNIKCPAARICPSVVVIVATVRALKFHGGMENLSRHVENIMKVFNLPAIVAINKFSTDTNQELDAIKEECKRIGVQAVVNESWAKGASGAAELAQVVIDIAAKTDVQRKRATIYAPADSIIDKITKVATKLYRADDVEFSQLARDQISEIQKLGEQEYAKFPVCIAKTPYSFSCDKTRVGAPNNFTIKVTSVKLCAGAGFIVVICGDIMTMPGLPKVPAAEQISIDKNGKIVGLF